MFDYIRISKGTFSDNCLAWHPRCPNSSIKEGEVTLMVCADYSKAFDTVEFKTVLMKMHNLGFSKDFLLWMINYLSNRKQFVQIDDKQSSLATVQFGVPQGSILGPVIFNLYVADLQDKLQCPCFQYADDTTFLIHSKPSDLHLCANEVNGAISRLREYSEGCNLALNLSKTKWMLISTLQMSRIHKLDERLLPIMCDETPLERISCTKLLGVYIDQHLSWGDQVNNLLSSCYGILKVLRRLKNLAPFHVRKTLAESLVLAKIDYACTVFHPLPQYQLKRLQRLQNACAGFVLRKFAKMEDLECLNWLPIAGRIEFNLLKLTHKALYNETFPEYLSLSLRTVNAYNLRSSCAPVIEVPRETGTFKYSAAITFNKLPADIRNICDYNLFCNVIRDYIRKQYF